MNGELSQNWVKIRRAQHLSGVQVLTANFVTQRETPRHVNQDYILVLLQESLLGYTPHVRLSTIPPESYP
jgi:hypothetical protein